MSDNTAFINAMNHEVMGMWNDLRAQEYRTWQNWYSTDPHISSMEYLREPFVGAEDPRLTKFAAWVNEMNKQNPDY